MATSNPPAAGWYHDPAGRFTYRYWTGAQWSEQVSSEGRTASDPVDASFATVPPAPGTDAPESPSAPTSTVEVTTRSGSGFGSVLAVVLGIVAIVVVVALLVSDTGDSSTPTSEEVVTTEAPTTEAPTTEAPTTTAGS